MYHKCFPSISYIASLQYHKVYLKFLLSTIVSHFQWFPISASPFVSYWCTVLVTLKGDKNPYPITISIWGQHKPFILVANNHATSIHPKLNVLCCMLFANDVILVGEAREGYLPNMDTLKRLSI